MQRAYFVFYDNSLNFYTFLDMSDSVSQFMSHYLILKKSKEKRDVSEEP